MKKLEQYPVAELTAMTEILDSVNKQMSEFYAHINQIVKKDEIDPVIAEEIKLSLTHKFDVNTKKIFEIQEQIVFKMKSRLGGCVMPKDLNNITDQFNKAVNARIAEKKKNEEVPKEEPVKQEKDVVKLNNGGNTKKPTRSKKSVE